MVADLVEQRFYVFCGVAREYLSTRARFTRKRVLDIKKIIDEYETMDQIQRLLDKKEGFLVHHSICHYEPEPVYVESYTVEEPSGYVKRWLANRLLQLLTKKRSDTIACLKKSPPAASNRGSLFETGVHDYSAANALHLCQTNLMWIFLKKSNMKIELKK
ncbi:hypothetical protein JG687_00015235 [Phytophthora cactorum]|nr:hypothetical protein JG687_00015235 [Phytophthora cactorum]